MSGVRERQSRGVLDVDVRLLAGVGRIVHPAIQQHGNGCDLVEISMN